MDIVTVKIIAGVGSVALVSYEVLASVFLPEVPAPSPLRILLILYAVSFTVFAHWREEMAQRYVIAFKIIPWGLTFDAVYRVYVSSFSFDTTIPLILVIFCCAMLAENRRELCCYLLASTLGVTVCGALVEHPETPLLSYNFTMIVMGAVMFILFGARLQDQATLAEKKQTLELAMEDLEANRDLLEKRVQERTADLEHAKELAEAASRAKSEFLATMSHEIRTPMNGVLGMTELLRNTRLNNQQEQFAQTIYESAGSLLCIIDDILDLSKLEAGKFSLENTAMDLRLLVEESVESLADQAQKKGLELIVDVPVDIGTSVKSDPVRLRQILTNLVGNAIKFTETGEVIVRLTESAVGQQQRHVLFEVIDTGIGISAEQQESIFDSFTQADGTTTRLYGGTGLGLAISQQIVGLMGGKLKVDSQPGSGSRFYFSVPLEVDTLPIPAMSSQRQVAGINVLIVDDNPTNREILDRHLSSWRVNTSCAESAAAALKILEDSDPASCFDLAILDMHMPGADGLELATAIRANPALSSMKIIFLSSMATAASVEKVRELNITGQLTKPVRQAQLYDAILVAVGGRPQRTSRGAPGSALTHSLSGHVLLVEDNVVNQAVGTGMLESIGLNVSVVGNGFEAIAQAREYRFDAILMDCQMPLLDGFEATRKVRQFEAELNLPRTKIVAVTANALKGDLERCLEAGMDEYLSKPFTKAQLHAVLAMCMPVHVTNIAADDAPPIRPTVGAAPAIDRSIINLLASMQEPGSPDIVERVVKLYLESSRELKKALRQAIDTADSVLLRETSHSLKSSSANIGATQIANLCATLEVMGRESRLDEATVVYGLFEKEYERALKSLEEIRAA